MGRGRRRHRYRGDRRYLNRRRKGYGFFSCKRQGRGRNSAAILRWERRQWPIPIRLRTRQTPVRSRRGSRARFRSGPARPPAAADAISLRDLRQGKAGARHQPARRRAAEPDRQDQGRPSGPAGRGLYLQRGPRPLPLTLCRRSCSARSAASSPSSSRRWCRASPTTKRWPKISKPSGSATAPSASGCPTIWRASAAVGPSS